MAEIKNFKHVFFRDSQDRVTKEYIMDGNGRRACLKYEYDANGNVIKEITEFDNYKTIALFEYDSEDNWIWYREEKYNNNLMYGSQSSQTFYDSQGRKTKDIETYTNGNETHADTIDYVYDSSGNLIKKEITFDTGHKQIYCNSYNADGKITNTICTFANSDTKITDFFYDDDGNEIKKVVEFSTGQKYIYESYYENGRKTKRCSFLPDGQILDEYKFIYDENDRLIKEIRKKQNGEIVISKFAYNISGNTVMDYCYDYENRIIEERVCLACTSIHTKYEYKKSYERKIINYPDNCYESFFCEYCNGRVIREKHTMSGDKEIILENFFNKHGQKVKKELTFGDKKLTFDRSFDKDGILRLETFCDDKGREATLHYSYNSNDDIIVEFFNNDNACCYVDLNGGLFPEIQ